MSFDRACDICHRTHWFDKSSQTMKPLEVCRSDAHGGKHTCKFCHFERRPRKTAEECVRSLEGAGFVFVNRDEFIKGAEAADEERFNEFYEQAQERRGNP
jgi:hypothetical protein